MSMLDVKAMNAALKGKTELLGFELKRGATGYELKMTLGRDGKAEIALVCGDVQNLELNPAGNGFEAMLELKIADMRDEGLERINFSVEEFAHEALFLHCADVKLKQV